MTYLRKLFTTGAVRKSPPSVIGAILAAIEPAPGQLVVEFGAGQGEITMPLAGQLKAQDATLLAFELDAEIGAALQREVPGARVLYEDAFLFPSFLPDAKQVDYFVCALPLSFFPRKKVAGLLQQMKQYLRPGGKAVIIFNAVWLLPAFRRELPGGRLRVFATLPVYFMYTFEK
jgi:phospholipid N-methyltransferase